jgi:colicin import membrane protein
MTAEELAAAAAEKEVEEALAAEELAAALAVAEKAAESPAPRSGTTEPGIPDAGTAPERAGPAHDIEQRLAATSARATPPRRDAAALAARQAALAIEQAALAAKQAALAAEQAALAAGPGVALPPFESERATGSTAEAGGERER